MNTNTSAKLVLAVVLAAFTLNACTGGETRLTRKRAAGEIGKQYQDTPRKSLFGEEGLVFGDTKAKPGVGGAGSGGIGVNSYLWRATLDTIAFLPVTNADPFGGVIITDWYAPPETPQERFKVNVYVLGRALRADGIRVSVFRQIHDAVGWRDATVEEDAGRKIEDAILTRARQLRNETRMLQQ